MADSPERGAQTDNAASRLEGWKAIAAYLNRDIRTVKRWEAAEALPIHRHHHSARSSAYAFPEELDAWRANRRPPPKPRATPLTPHRRALILAPLMFTALLTVGGGPARSAAATGGQPPANVGEVFRKVWTGNSVIGRDGRHVVSIDANGNPVLHEVSTGVNRPLTTDANYGRSYAANGGAISRDGRQVAYWWMNLDAREGAPGAEIRIARLDGAPSPRTVLVVNEDTYPLDWSHDGRWVALGGQFGVSVASTVDGSRRTLHTLNGRGPAGVFFSPDGRYLAFDAPTGQVSDPFDVFVAAVDGSGIAGAISDPAHDRIMDWSPDGTHLLFTSDRSGSVDLWALPVADGKPAGHAKMIRRGFVVGRSFGLSSDGRLFVQQSFPDRDVHVVTIDLESGRQLAPPIRPIRQFVGMNEQPAWSPDGKQLAYVSHRTGRQPFPIIAILAEDTTEVKELRPQLTSLRGLSWAPDGTALVGGGADLQDNPVMFRIDVRTGEVTVLPTLRPTDQGAFPTWSPDGRRIYYRARSNDSVLVERDLATGGERELIRAEDLGGQGLSPDGRWLAAVRSRQSIVLVPVGPGSTREIFSVKPPSYFAWNRMAWTPDGRAIIVRKNTGANATGAELWLVPIDGAAARRLDVDVRRMPGTAFSGIALNPDGRRLAFVSDGETRDEVWALEGFLHGLRSQ